MELASKPLLERSAFQRLLFAMMVIALVLAFLAGVTWFIRSFILPPRIAIPSPVSVAAAPPTAVPPSSSAEKSSEPSTAQFSTAPPEPVAATNVAADSDAATTGSVSHGSRAGIAAVPIAGPVPLPRSRRQEFVAIAGPVPPPRATRARRTSSAIYNHHRPE